MDLATLAIILGVVAMVIIWIAKSRGGLHDPLMGPRRRDGPMRKTPPAAPSPVQSARPSGFAAIQELVKLAAAGAINQAELAKQRARQGGAAPLARAPGASVHLIAPGRNIIDVIKLVREERRDIGLKQAKDIVEAAPSMLTSGLDPASAAQFAAKLRAAGATVEVK